jgi:hypothetical protein
MRMQRPLTALLLTLLSLAGCGDFGATTTVIRGTPALDGYVIAGTLPVTDDTGMSAGDNPSGATARMFVSFPLGSIPAGAKLQSAVLEMNQTEVHGAPYLDLGPLLVDHLDYGSGLESDDYDTAALSAGLVELSSDAAPGTRTAYVTTQVAADLAAGRERSQFRLRFGADTDGDADADYARFATGEAAVGQPVLRVRYTR